jgi:hypothetical protein
MYAMLRVPAIIAIGSIAMAGCAGSDLFGSNSASSDVTTSSMTQSQAQKVDPACGTLALEIDTLRREGVAEKIEKAAAKKYKMTAADLTKANQLNRANAEFQSKCSTLPRSAATPTTPMPDPAAVSKAAPALKKAAAAVPAATTTVASR